MDGGSTNPRGGGWTSAKCALLWMVMVLAAMILALSFLGCATPRPAMTATGAMGPPTALSGETVAEERLHLPLASHHRPLLVVFWSSGCKTCAADAADLGALQRGLSDRLQVVGVCTDVDLEAAQNFKEKHALPYESLRDPGKALARRLGVAGMPALVLFAPDGEVVARGRRLSDIAATLAVSLPPPG